MPNTDPEQAVEKAGATPYHFEMGRELERLCLGFTGRQVRGGKQSLADGLTHVRRELPMHEACLEDQEHRWALGEFGEGSVGRGMLRDGRLHVARMQSFISRWSRRLEATHA